jgi:uncharacterized membrane-anchored protein
MRQRPPSGTTGVLRVDARASRLASRLHRGDIAVVDQADLDGASAQVLVSRGVAAVVNAAPASSGRYPNLGPSVLVAAGIPLLSGVGSALLTTQLEGREARLDGNTLWMGDEQVAKGTLLDPESVTASAAAARGGIAAQLADVAVNAAAFLVEERGLLLEGEGLPGLTSVLTDRHALLVGPAYGGAAELRLLKRYRRRYRPVLVGIDAGGDVLRAAGLRPDLLVGEPATMSDEVLRVAREVVLLAGAEGVDRVHDLNVPARLVDSGAASEDLALLLAQHGGAALVVLAGLPTTLEELLDRGRAAAASGLMTRFAASGRVLSAQAAHVLTPRRSWGLPALSLLLASGLGGAIAIAHGPLAQAWQDFVR